MSTHDDHSRYHDDNHDDHEHHEFAAEVETHSAFFTKIRLMKFVLCGVVVLGLVAVIALVMSILAIGGGGGAIIEVSDKDNKLEYCYTKDAPKMQFVADLQCDLTPDGGYCTFTCSHGLVPSDTLKCSKGKWSNVPVCVCESLQPYNIPGATETSLKECADTEVGGKCEIHCEYGLEIAEFYTPYDPHAPVYPTQQPHNPYPYQHDSEDDNSGWKQSAYPYPDTYNPNPYDTQPPAPYVPYVPPTQGPYQTPVYATCGHNGWEPLPKCVCPTEPTHVPGGFTATCRGTAVGCECETECNGKLVPSGGYTCQKDGTWEPKDNPSCLCPAPIFNERVENIDCAAGTTPEMMQCSVVCPNGFECGSEMHENPHQSSYATFHDGDDTYDANSYIVNDAIEKELEGEVFEEEELGAADFEDDLQDDKAYGTSYGGCTGAGYCDLEGEWQTNCYCPKLPEIFFEEVRGGLHEDGNNNVQTCADTHIGEKCANYCNDGLTRNGLELECGEYGWLSEIFDFASCACYPLPGNGEIMEGSCAGVPFYANSIFEYCYDFCDYEKRSLGAQICGSDGLDEGMPENFGITLLDSLLAKDEGFFAELISQFIRSNSLAKQGETEIPTIQDYLDAYNTEDSLPLDDPLESPFQCPADVASCKYPKMDILPSATCEEKDKVCLTSEFCKSDGAPSAGCGVLNGFNYPPNTNQENLPKGFEPLGYNALYTPIFECHEYGEFPYGFAFCNDDGEWECDDCVCVPCYCGAFNDETITTLEQECDDQQNASGPLNPCCACLELRMGQNE